jgi:hypothetical protein
VRGATGNRTQQTCDKWALAEHGFVACNGKKLPKTSKYEAKRLAASLKAFRLSISREWAFHDWIEQLSTLFILTTGNFSEVFTSYSHALCCRPRQRA